METYTLKLINHENIKIKLIFKKVLFNYFVYFDNEIYLYTTSLVYRMILNI